MSSRASRETVLHLSMAWGMLALLRLSSLHPMAIITVLCALVAFKFRDAVKLTNRQLAGASVGVLLANLILNRMIKETGYFLGIGSISFAHLVAWMLILFTVVQRNENTRFARHAISACLVVACAMSTHLMVVVPVAAVGVVLMTLGLREGQGLKVGWPQFAPLLMIFLFGAGLTTIATYSETRLGYLLRLFSIVPSSGIRFPPNASLDALQRWNSSDLVVIRVYGKEPPPYLIGRTYDAYDDKSFWRWRNTKVELTSKETARVETASGLRDLPLIYPQGERIGEPGEPVRVEYPGGGSGYTFYSPREFYGVASTLPQLHRYSSGRLEERALDSFDGVYHLFPFKDGWKSPVPVDTPTELPPELAVNLSMPPDLSPIVAQLAHEVAGEQTTAKRKADFITSFLQNKFTYGYEYPFDKKGDALEEFLRDRPPAHCEFFATAGALMLRTQGVPTRYVTGFVCQEKSFGSDYFVVRLKHAHAWMEVYLPDQGWVTYDPTPPGVLDTPDSRADFLHAAMEWMSNQWRRMVGMFKLSPKEILARLLAWVKGLSWPHLLALIALVGLYRAGRQYIQYLKNKSAKERAWQFSQGRHADLTPMLESLQESVTPLEWRREFNETNGEWLRRLADSTAPAELLAKTKQFLDRYDSHRYSGSLSDAEKVALDETLRELEGLFVDHPLDSREAENA